jgi:hypothetical protein
MYLKVHEALQRKESARAIHEMAGESLFYDALLIKNSGRCGSKTRSCSNKLLGYMAVLSSQEPEVLLPPGVNEVPAHAFALLPHSQRQAICLVDALLHELFAAATQNATSHNKRETLELVQTRKLYYPCKKKIESILFHWFDLQVILLWTWYNANSNVRKLGVLQGQESECICDYG